MNLDELGWRGQLEAYFNEYEPGLIPGRVAVEHRSLYRVLTTDGDITAELSGRMRHHAAGVADLPVVGDWVALEMIPGSDHARIHHLLPRWSRFSRKAPGEATEEQIIAANIDTVFIVTGLDDNFNLRRIERYLVLSWESGARPVIVLNKADLADELEERIAETERIAQGVPVIAISARDADARAQLLPYIGAGETVALLGSSGVGKSTLANLLAGMELQRTQEVSDMVGKGKHTTTHRELIPLRSGGMIIDSPGMREIGLWSSAESLHETFEDIESLVEQCRFRDCGHGGDPGCALDAAVADGTVDEARVRSYMKMLREMAWLDRRQDARAMIAEKQRWKAITRSVRGIDKRR
jgi:ribosome biogenesis GTPase